MSRDEEHIRSIRDRVARMRQTADSELGSSDQQAENSPAANRDRDYTSPIQRGTSRTSPARTIAFYVGMVLAVFVLAELALTVSQYTGPDIGDAKRTGKATVLSCQQYGPVGNGFGYWDECTADVMWNGGTRERITPDKRGFFSADEIGTTVTVGDLGLGRSGRSLARADLPDRPLVTIGAGIITMIAVIIGMALIWIGWNSLRRNRRRRD